ncbi:MAG: NAD-dependent epimerase/dehydratase family protein [Patescibacteria group bacterium]|nr:NAD-dependent epimerase/dehydratase family protein [Patescibacteria group bacterium]
MGYIQMKTAVVCGASGLIGSYMVRRLKAENYFVRGLSRSKPKYWISEADEYWTCDLRERHDNMFVDADEVYQFACQVGGIGYISDHTNDANMLRDSTLIDINVLESCGAMKPPKIFFASSACVYNVPNKRFYAESDAYPANCDNEFAWQKLFAERLYQAYAVNYGMEIRIGRIFNTYGVGMTWTGGREKSVAALCRKVAQAKVGDAIEVWGNGEQTRSYTYIDDCVEGIWRLMQSDVKHPVNIGPSHEVSIRDLVAVIGKVARKNVMCKFGAGPKGVSKICSDNITIHRLLGWEPKIPIEEGLKIVFPWIQKQVDVTPIKA